jgi:hypothetical protein
MIIINMQTIENYSNNSANNFAKDLLWYGFSKHEAVEQLSGYISAYLANGETEKVKFICNTIKALV